MIKDKRHVFWQAFFLTLLFFSLGIVMGVYLEQIRIDNTNLLFYQSEVSLYDSFALAKLSDTVSVSCEDLNEASVAFADKIYLEARELERFDGANKITDSLKILHKKYDLLRTLLWMNIISEKDKCNNLNTVVYLYVYETDDLQIKSEQAVWARILQDLKEDVGNEVTLIPIAVDNEITSLDYLIKRYGVETFPAVVINEKKILYEIHSVGEIKSYLE